MSDWLHLWTENEIPHRNGEGEEDTPAIMSFLLDAPNEGRRACVVVCPGGGYFLRAGHEGEPIARWLNSIGLSAVVLRYRVQPYRYPSALRDAQRAIRYVRNEAEAWGIDPEKIGILGFSAGGHLAANASVDNDQGQPEAADPIERHSSRPDFQVLCYPVISFGDAFGHKGSMYNLLGEEPDPELAEFLSLERRVTPETPPAFLWHTADDAGVLADNSYAMAMALRANQVAHELHVFENGKHGLALSEELPDVAEWTKLCERWLARRGMTSPVDGHK
ncbi:alpha/beta hydrolase [Paenibacillus koleovorans]|uniref:alpha/beta hydrolase n=1 Tax=Paenibacillus koleovorans TaxID=121608 RepID=UPI000FDC3F54|nr:alpha/beta hydrolase [Paenibacillus koleovorans]